LLPVRPNIGSVFVAGYSTGYFGKWHLDPISAMLIRHTAVTRGQDEVSRRGCRLIKEQKGQWLACLSFINPHNIYSRHSARNGRAPPGRSRVVVGASPISAKEAS
jgi:hypothetical protein